MSVEKKVCTRPGSRSKVSFKHPIYGQVTGFLLEAGYFFAWKGIYVRINLFCLPVDLLKIDFLGFKE
jgi:hypothetical protein